MPETFVHLHVHSEYSIVDSLIRIKELVSRTAELEMPALALTDQSNLFAMVKFYQAAQSQGIKPLIGADLRIADDEEPRYNARVLMLCQDQTGYRNLSRLITRSYTEGQYQGQAMIRRQWLEDANEGLLLLCADREGDIGQAILGHDLDLARQHLSSWQRMFGDRFYLMLERLGRAREASLVADLVGLAGETGVPLVAANGVCFLSREDYDAHEARVCINEGTLIEDTRRQSRYTEQQYLRSPAEMRALFEDLPEAIENSLCIAQRCNLELTMGEYFLPRFPLPEGQNIDGLIREQSRQGLQARFAELFDDPQAASDEDRKPYHERLETELEVIIHMGFPGYFLIVADFIHWAKENQIPVGPGRGSGAGSLVAYALGITDLDPLEYDLLFERFLNPERVSMPDFDVDFCMERRDEVIEYVAQRYGRDHVAQIITHGTMAAKAVVRDVGRVLGHPYGFVDQIAKLIPFDLKMTLKRALEEGDELRQRYEEEEDVQALIDLAKKLEGLTRNAGRHAGGVVIAPRPLTDFTPLYCEQGAESTVTQLDMGDVETLGLVKFDFLGLRTLTIIHWAVQTIDQLRTSQSEPPLIIAALPLDDPTTYEMIRRAETTAVFQLESRGMKELIKRLEPDSFAELIALVALFRPGPLQSGMVDDYIERKHGRAPVRYPHPALEPILKPTYGIILYQEQVMQIAQVLAGFTLGAADLLRRAMGKKKAEEMAQQREFFVEGALKNAVEKGVAMGIFDLMEKFAGYGFNKSHSAAYALVAYQTAWLKAHYPAAFMAAVLSSDMDNTDKVVGLIDECQRMEIEVLVPDVNVGEFRFTVNATGQILYGLGAIKGVGESAIITVVNERQTNGPYQDLFELCRRIDVKKANRRVLEALSRAGALDVFDDNRAKHLAMLPDALKAADQHVKNRQAGQRDLFGLVANDEDNCLSTGNDDIKEWSLLERLAGEKIALGLFFTGHPIDRFSGEIDGLVSNRLGTIAPGAVRVGGQIISIRTINTKRGTMAIVVLDDKTGRVDVVVYANVLEQYGELISKDRLIIAEGECRPDDFSGGFSVIAEGLFDMEQARGEFARELILRLHSAKLKNGLIKELYSTLIEHQQGTCQVSIDYHHTLANTRIRLPEPWRVQVNDDLLERLRTLLGDDQVEVKY